jgi:hypothetical protein
MGLPLYKVLESPEETGEEGKDKGQIRMIR